MKEKYFNNENIEQVSCEIFDYIEKHINIRKRIFSPHSSALLILDMQKYFLDMKSHAHIPSSRTIIKNINNLINLYKSSNLPIIFTKHINDKSNAGMMGVWWKDIISAESEMNSLSENINSGDSKVIVKSQYDAFYKTELEDYLKKLGIKQLVVTGVMTHLCCETTVRSAFTRNYEIFFPVDCTADYNLEFHKASFLNLSHGFATPLLVKEIINELEKK